MLSAEGLTKYYGELAAVKGISFTVNEGEILGFLGPNAAGKTTTMRILTCFMPPTSGTATVAGYDVLENSIEVRKNVGYMPENVPLYTDMRVSEYLRYRAKLKEVPRGKIRVRTDYVVERCGLGDVRKKIIGQLSKGFRQRVGLAATLIHDPKVLILDEPTIGLDPGQIRQVRHLIKQLGGEHTIILSTHILPEVEMVCGRVIIIDGGRIVAMDTPGGLTRRMKGAGTILIEARGNGEKIAEAVRRVDGVLKVSREGSGDISSYAIQVDVKTDPREKISSEIVRHGGLIREMHSEKTTLEDIFVQLTTKETPGGAT